MPLALFDQLFSASRVDFEILSARGPARHRRKMNDRPAGCERVSVTLWSAQVAFDDLKVAFPRERFNSFLPAEAVNPSIQLRIKLRHQASTDEASRACDE